MRPPNKEERRPRQEAAFSSDYDQDVSTHVTKVLVDREDALLRSAQADREAAWDRVLAAFVEFDYAWSLENDLREDTFRRRLGRLRERHQFGEDAARRNLS